LTDNQEKTTAKMEWHVWVALNKRSRYRNGGIQLLSYKMCICRSRDNLFYLSITILHSWQLQ